MLLFFLSFHLLTSSCLGIVLFIARTHHCHPKMGNPTEVEFQDTDSDILALLGKKQVLKRRFGFWSLFGFAVCELITWETVLALFSQSFNNDSHRQPGEALGGTLGEPQSQEQIENELKRKRADAARTRAEQNQHPMTNQNLALKQTHHALHP